MQSSNRRNWILIASVFILASFAAVFFFMSTPPSQDSSNQVRPHSPVFGPAEAPVTIVEVLDPSCEACRAFFPYVKDILAESPNDVRLVIRYALFHKGSEEVMRLLEAARMQGLYPKVLEAVLYFQPDWHDDPMVTAAWSAAKAAGLDVEKARKDMHSPSIDAIIEVDKQDIQAMGVKKTPTFFVNGQELLEIHPDALRKLVQSEQAKAKK